MVPYTPAGHQALYVVFRGAKRTYRSHSPSGACAPAKIAATIDGHLDRGREGPRPFTHTVVNEVGGRLLEWGSEPITFGIRRCRPCASRLDNGAGVEAYGQSLDTGRQTVPLGSLAARRPTVPLGGAARREWLLAARAGDGPRKRAHACLGGDRVRRRVQGPRWRVHHSQKPRCGAFTGLVPTGIHRTAEQRQAAVWRFL